jgi:6-phosphogluconolactonase
MRDQNETAAASRDIEIVEDYDALCRRGAEQFIESVHAGVTKRGSAYVALSGGSTPRGLYAMLASEPYASRVPWEQTHFFWGDERPVPPDHKDSNYKMAFDAMLGPARVGSGNIHRMPADAQDAELAAQQYQNLINDVVKEKTDGTVPRFDLIHLGMGDDGHTASLFPHSPALSHRSDLVLPNYVEKLQQTRMTFSYTLLNAAACVVFLVSGAGKAQVLEQVLNGPIVIENYPSQGIDASGGRLLWLIDKAAASALSKR